MVITPSKLRKNLYNLLDSVLEEGELIEISRKGQILRIVPQKRPSRLDSIIPKKITSFEDKDLMSVDWEDKWKPFI